MPIAKDSYCMSQTVVTLMELTLVPGCLCAGNSGSVRKRPGKVELA